MDENKANDLIVKKQAKYMHRQFTKRMQIAGKDMKAAYFTSTQGNKKQLVW